MAAGRRAGACFEEVDGAVCRAADADAGADAAAVEGEEGADSAAGSAGGGKGGAAGEGVEVEGEVAEGRAE